MLERSYLFERGLKSHYWGTQGYLSAEQKQEINEWLEQKDSWTLEERAERMNQYKAVYRPPQSYIQLLAPSRQIWQTILWRALLANFASATSIR